MYVWRKYSFIYQTFMIASQGCVLILESRRNTVSSLNCSLVLIFLLERTTSFAFLCRASRRGMIFSCTVFVIVGTNYIQLIYRFNFCCCGNSRLTRRRKYHCPTRFLRGHTWVASLHNWRVDLWYSFYTSEPLCVKSWEAKEANCTKIEVQEEANSPKIGVQQQANSPKFDVQEKANSYGDCHTHIWLRAVQLKGFAQIPSSALYDHTCAKITVSS